MYIQIATHLHTGAQLQSRVSVNRVAPRFQHIQQAALESHRAAPASAPSSSHTVQAGDNLSRIVNAYYRSQNRNPSMQEVYAGVTRVAKANGIANPDVIHPGMHLNLSVLDAGSSAAPLPATPPRISMTPLPAPLQPAPATSSGPGEEAESGPIAAPAVLESTVRVSENEALESKASATDAPLASGGPVLSGSAERALEILRGTPQHLANLADLIRDVMDGREIQTTAPMRAPWHHAVGGETRLASNYGMRKDPFTGQPSFHDGIDLAAEAGAPIYPIEPGRVVFSGWQSGYGRIVIVEHDDGLESVYAHNDENHVRVGDVVTKETVIAAVGSSGRSTGPHLHLEIRKDGKAVNPISHFHGEHTHPHLHEQ